MRYINLIAIFIVLSSCTIQQEQHATKTVDIPVTPIDNQGSNPTCSYYSVLAWVEAIQKQHSGEDHNYSEAALIYSMIKEKNSETLVEDPLNVIVSVQDILQHIQSHPLHLYKAGDQEEHILITKAYEQMKSEVYEDKEDFLKKLDEAFAFTKEYTQINSEDILVYKETPLTRIISEMGQYQLSDVTSVNSSSAGPSSSSNFYEVAQQQIYWDYWNDRQWIYRNETMHWSVLYGQRPVDRSVEINEALIDRVVSTLDERKPVLLRIPIDYNFLDRESGILSMQTGASQPFNQTTAHALLIVDYQLSFVDENDILHQSALGDISPQEYKFFKDNGAKVSSFIVKNSWGYNSKFNYLDKGLGFAVVTLNYLLQKPSEIYFWF